MLPKLITSDRKNETPYRWGGVMLIVISLIFLLPAIAIHAMGRPVYQESHARTMELLPALTHDATDELKEYVKVQQEELHSLEMDYTNAVMAMCIVVSAMTLVSGLTCFSYDALRKKYEG